MPLVRPSSNAPVGRESARTKPNAQIQHQMAAHHLFSVSLFAFLAQVGRVKAKNDIHR
jgi:hypothetical protein